MLVSVCGSGVLRDWVLGSSTPLALSSLASTSVIDSVALSCDLVDLVESTEQSIPVTTLPLPLSWPTSYRLSTQGMVNVIRGTADVMRFHTPYDGHARGFFLRGRTPGPVALILLSRGSLVGTNDSEMQTPLSKGRVLPSGLPVHSRLFSLATRSECG